MKVTAVDNNGTIEIAAVSFTKAGKKLADNEAAFNNTYTANKLSISKTVAGNLGDKSKYFDFTVTLTGKEGEEYSLPATITGGSDKSGKKENVAISGTTTFKLKHGDTITIENLPAGVSYKVEEATPSDYTMNATGQEGTMDAEAKTAAFTNTKTGRHRYRRLLRQPSIYLSIRRRISNRSSIHCKKTQIRRLIIKRI